MKLYMDVCCLKRPFDDQSILRNHLEAEAVLALEKAIESGLHTFVRSVAHDLENARNSDATRRARVETWLARLPLPNAAPSSVTARTDELVKAGLGAFDAFHLAWAEALGADVLLTVDDRFLAKATRSPAIARVRVLTPIDLVKEAKL